MKSNGAIYKLLFLLTGICYLTEFAILSLVSQSHLLNGVLGGLWSLGQIGILIIVRYLYRWKIMDGKRWKAFGAAVAAAGSFSYLINYIFGYWLSMDTRIFLPLGALLTGVGMVTIGIQVIAGKRWRGIGGKLPLIVGLYPFLVMFPLLIIEGHPNLTAIMGWGVPWLLLGFGMANESRGQTKSKNRFRPMKKISSTTKLSSHVAEKQTNA